MTHEMHNGEHTEEWPAADRPSDADDSDAPVNMSDAGESGADEAISAPETTNAEDAMADELNGQGLPEPTAATDDDADAPIDDADTASAADIRGANNVDIKNGGARDIDATSVSITQGGARDIEATTVTINQGGAARISADELTISQGGVGLARAEHLTIQDGGNAFAVLADKATLDPETSVFLLIAGSTSGDVRPVLDWRAAAAFGAGFALVLGLVRRLRR